MSREPSYPEDAAVGAGKAGASAKGEKAKSPKAGSPTTESAPKGEKGDAKRTKQLMTGAAIGIGSAAIVAALLYANRSKKNEKGSG